jgi:hypothetical protein
MIFCTFDDLKIEKIVQELEQIKYLPFEKMDANFHLLKKEIEENKIKLGSNYGGGVVVYIEKNGKHGIICAEVDFGTAKWGGSPIGDDKNKYKQFETSSTLGEGLNNSRQIAENANFEIIDYLFFSRKEYILTAAEMCLKSTHNGYNDWFLPNCTEMHEIHSFLIKSPNNNLSMNPGLYWTSNECGQYQAFAYDFSLLSSFTAEITGRLKICRVRGVRKF